MAVLKYLDWVFTVDVPETLEVCQRSGEKPHLCDFVFNFGVIRYQHRRIVPFLKSFGLDVHDFYELRPRDPYNYLAVYRVKGKIQKQGKKIITIDGVPFIPEPDQGGFFRLVLGPVVLPWKLPDDEPNPDFSPLFSWPYYRDTAILWEKYQKEYPVLFK